MSHHFGIDISHNLTKPDWNAENQFPGGMVASKELRFNVTDYDTARTISANGSRQGSEAEAVYRFILDATDA
jgi:hypothetical protein